MVLRAGGCSLIQAGTFGGEAGIGSRNGINQGGTTQWGGQGDGPDSGSGPPCGGCGGGGGTKDVAEGCWEDLARTGAFCTASFFREVGGYGFTTILLR